MKYLSVCSGIEAASVAWHPLGWEPVGFAEIEKFPSQVLAHRFPGVKNFGDMTKFREWDIEPGTIDLLVGGTPCQAFSVAGLRKGLQDPRGNLALTFVAMVDHYRPEWVVWENVPGVLSSSGGRDFGAFLGALGQLGYGFAYRVLDAQFFGVAQRRRRVFVVAHSSGDPRRAAEVLFEPESLRGDSPPSREAGQKTTADPGAGASSRGCWWDGGQVSQTLDAVLAKGQTMPEKNRFPAVLQPSLYESHPQPIGLDEEQNASIDLFGTLKARTESGGFQGAVMQPSLYESHPHDCRVTGPVEQPPTVSAKWGTGGNNTTLVTDGAIGFAENFDAIELTQTAPAMTTSGYRPTQNAGGLGALQCNAEQSAKAYSIAPGRQGTPEKVDDIHVTEQDTSRTLDGTCADPERRQGGTLIVQPSFAYDDRNQAVSTDTHHTPLVTDGEASAFSWQSGADMRGMVPRPTAQLQRCQIEAVMVQPAMHVRRLTPMECERLQGFPDGWSDIKPGGKETADSPRYKALGNSMAVPVMRWIGERIAMAVK